MPEVKDVFPFSEQLLPDFLLMQRFPKQTDIANFVDASLALVEADGNATAYDDFDGNARIKTSLWLPDGIINVSKVFDNRKIETVFPNEVPDEIYVTGGVFDPEGNGSNHDFLITQVISSPQVKKLNWHRICGVKITTLELMMHKGPQFTTYPNIFDEGISRPNEITAILSDLIDMKADELPQSLDLRDNTVTSSDMLLAEFKAKAEEATKALIADGAAKYLVDSFLPMPENETRMTVCSQKTLQAVTKLILASST